jgi:hypothetical protein
VPEEVDEDTLELLDECEEYLGEGVFTDWEEEFLTSIRERTNLGRGLSEAQLEKLMQIHGKI